MVNRMAYVNVAEWSPEHVAEWLRGLEYSLLPYVQFFLNNGIDGRHLLNLTANDLEDLHIFKIGHQQLILEAVELLRQLHYSLNSETLQSLAVKLSCKARSLHNDLKLNGPRDHLENIRQERVSTNVLSAVSEVLTSVKVLVSWLDRPPFQQDTLCMKLKKTVLKLSIELASTTQRDQFAERPHSLIKKNSAYIAELCDQFVQNSMDSLILQPASLDIAMIKKKPDEELGIHIKSTYSGVHIIGGIKDQSPAKNCNKVERGDEIVQVNYQTVIGWQQKKLVTTMTEHSTELQLTLKKRPRHVNLLGEVIILRPYRIPSKKTAKKCYWPEGSQHSGLEMGSKSSENEGIRDNFPDDDDDSAFLPASSNNLILTKELALQSRLYEGNSTAAVQRRATVSGASPTVLKSPVNIEDLMNGVFSSKSTDHFSRSISHDPSTKKQSSETAVSNKFDNEYKYLKGATYQNTSIEYNNKSAYIFSSTSKYDTLNVGEKDKCSVVDSLPVQGEEYVVIDNKSLSNENNFAVSHKICTSSEETKIVSHLSGPDDSSMDKSSSVLYNWENNVTEFHGRRPSAHDISNEIAGSKETDINPVFLRKASKIKSSSVINGDSFCKETEDMSSYQVVIVGGVPQKCVSSSKEEREKNKNFDILYRHRIKEKLSGEYRSRRISCKDLGKGDCEGWLYKQKERKGLFPAIHQWVKRWIVLKDNCLYCYKDKSDSKAECLISLPGSIVSPALECKTRKFAFKICQQQLNFYFATESQRDLTNWMNKMGLAAIAYDASGDITTSGFLKANVVLGIANNFYSETEDSENSSPTFTRHGDNHSTERKVSSCEFSLDSHKRNKPNIQSWNKNMPTSAVSSKTKYFHSDNMKLTEAEIHLKDSFDNKLMSTSGKPRISSINSFSSEPYTASRNRYVSNENSRISYNTSSNCAVSYSHLRGIRKHSRTISDQSSLCDEIHYEEACHEGKTDLHSSDWNSIDEEFDVATSSLGRQPKPFVKEITPGLVARMAVSYTNLSKKTNATSSGLSKKYKFSKAVPAPGYVAKISDSFDHLAMLSKASTSNHEKVHREEIPYSEREKVSYQSYKCKRSASESQVTKHIEDHHSSKIGTSSENSQQCYNHNKSTVTQTEKFVSLLDKEYNKVFDGKKVSQHQLKSPTNQSKFYYLNSSQRDQKFFSTNSHTENLYCLNANSIVRNNYQTANISSASKGAESDFTVNKSLSLPYGSNSSEISCSDITSTQIPEKSLSSCGGIENVGFSFKDQIRVDNFGLNCCQSSFSNSNSKQNNDLQSENSTSSYELSNVHRNSPAETASDVDSPKMSFKFFNSPKFMKKLTSPKLDKKNIFKSKKQAKELKKAEQKEISIRQNERKFFGSPILVRAFFGSPKTEKKVVTVSSGVQTDLALLSTTNTMHNETLHDHNRNQNNADADLPQTVSSNIENCQEITISNSSSNSSLNSNASNCILPFTNSVYYVEAKIKPQITVSLPLASDKACEGKASPSDLSRTPLKPMMGVAMLNKKRLPSISGESSISISSSKSSQDGSFRETTQVLCEVSMEINGDEEINNRARPFNEANSSVYSIVPNSEEIENSDGSC